MNQSQRQSLMNRLLNVNIGDYRYRGQENLSNMLAKLGRDEKSWSKQAGVLSNISRLIGNLTGKSAIGKVVGDSVDYIGRNYFDKGADPEELIIPTKDRLWGVGKKFDIAKKLTEEDISNKKSLKTMLEKMGGVEGLLGEDFMKDWKGGFAKFSDFKNTSLYDNSAVGEAISILDMITSPTSFENGGLVKKYQEGGIASGLEDIEASSGRTQLVPTGRTQQKWVMKTDPFTGIEFPEKRNVPIYDIYNLSDESGRYEKSGSTTTDESMGKVTTLSQLGAAVTEEALKSASEYIDVGGYNFKRDKKTQALFQRAKEGDERALTEIALLATSRRPDLKDRNFNAIVEAIRGALPTIEMDMGMESTEMQGLIKGKETAIEGLKPKNQNILHGLATGTDKRDLRRQRESLTSDLDEVYDVYRRGQEDYVSNEFSIVDTLFNKEELGLG